jgi:probable HAF family extracellular repeat protein
VFSPTAVYTHGFLYTGSTYITLDDPFADNNGGGTFALDINARGQVVGYYYDSNSTAHGFLYDNGSYTTLDDPSAGTNGHPFGTYATGINDAGEVVGYFFDPDGHQYNFIYSHGTYTTLDSLGILRTPGDITNADKIIGSYFDVNAIGHSYIGTPTVQDSLPQDKSASPPATHGNDALGALTAAADTFVFSPDFGKETITHYDVNHDVLAFDHHLFSSETAAQVLSQTHDSNAGAVIAANAHDTLTLTGVTVAELQAAQNAHVDWLHFF